MNLTPLTTSIGSFEIVTTTAGAISIRDNVTGETMHNPVGPWREANALYIEQSNLAERLGTDLGKELVVFDVGLGAAANALATLHCANALATRRPLKLVSFERDLTLLEFALAHANEFSHFAGHETSIRALLDHGQWTGPSVTWELRHGDFPELIAHEPAKANLIFFDPYSPKKNADMWSVETFARLRRACDETGATLFTYSRATPVRVALLLGGFYIGAGMASGLKNETTQASTHAELLSHPLDRSWLARFDRSHAQLPPGALPSHAAEISRLVQAHTQWQLK